MLQSLRENMKGPVAKVVVAVAVGAMILFGVESLFVNSVGGAEVAKVNGEEITPVELKRAIEQQKNRLRQQFQLEEDNEMLSEERLREPALMNLVRQKALQQAALAAGMNVSPDIIKAELAKAFVRDGKFDSAFLNNYIAAYGYTPATLAQSESNAYVLRQLFNGINQSEFITAAELSAMAAIAGQKRSFTTVFIPRAKVEGEVTITDAEIDAFYQSNAAEFTDPEKVSVEYVDLTIKDLAAKQVVSDEEIRQEYDREVAEFSSKTEYHLSHILIDKGESAQKTIDEVASKLAAGESFAELAKAYSNDLGSKALGGELGVLVEGAFPKAFEAAAMALAKGQVSVPVVTDSGAHFIRLDDKVVTEAPAFEARKNSLAAILKEQKAGVEYLEKIQALEEASFGAGSLANTAALAGVDVKVSSLFSRAGGKSGVEAIESVVTAAFADDVYMQGQNSRVLEVGGERALVIRLKDKIPAKLKDLAEVKATLTKRLTDTKVATQLQNLAADVVVAIEQGKVVESVAQAAGYEAKVYEKLDRSSADADFMVLREVFSMARPKLGNPVTSTVNGVNGLTIVLLTDVINGDAEALPVDQRNAMEEQLRSQMAMGSVEAYENRVFEEAKYKLH